MARRREEAAPTFTMRDARKLRRLLVPTTPQQRQQRRDAPIHPSIHFIHEILPQGAWKGRRCFIVGGGPSVKGVDMDMLRGELVIGINRAHEICNPTILFAMDQRLWGWVVKGELGEEPKKKMAYYAGIKCWVMFQPEMNLIPPDECYFVHNVPEVALSNDLKEGLHCGCNGGYAALNLAILLGASPIYLLGYDMVQTEGKKKVWWHDGYLNDGQSSAVYDLFKGEFKTHTGAFQAAMRNGVDIVNLNPKSGLDVFRKSTIKKEKITSVRRPLVVSFYTPPYKELAARMRKSVSRFGFETDVVAIESRGDWIANVHYKTNFMLDKLREHKRDILWLDADSVVNSYPTLFDNFDGDLGVHYIDWARHTGGKITQIELDDAVTYLAYNDRTLGMVEDWVKFNLTCPRRAEQLNLQIMLREGAYEEKGLKVVNLPAEYCTIFDTMVDIPNPVIEQFQASRQLRRVT